MFILRAPAPATPQIIPAPGGTTPVQLGPEIFIPKNILSVGDLLKIGISAQAVSGVTVQDTVNFYVALDDVFLIGGGVINPVVNASPINPAGTTSFATFWQEGLIGYSGRLIFSLINQSLAQIADDTTTNPYTSCNAGTALVDTVITDYTDFNSTDDGAFFIPVDGSPFNLAVPHTLKVFAAWTDGTDPTNTIQLENFMFLDFRPDSGNTSAE